MIIIARMTVIAAPGSTSRSTVRWCRTRTAATISAGSRGFGSTVIAMAAASYGSVLGSAHCVSGNAIVKIRTGVRCGTISVSGM